MYIFFLVVMVVLMVGVVSPAQSQEDVRKLGYEQTVTGEITAALFVVFVGPYIVFSFDDEGPTQYTITLTAD